MENSWKDTPQKRSFILFIPILILNEKTNEDIEWMKESAQQLIDIKSKTMTAEEIKKL
ncbi:hypothetical protein EB1_06740 [Empedobacter brevis NBRC 14943 = ATCC 43319]|uniref:Uncharacterized protein n=1 Tax=Empedobacter brevis NBRC 14943 = ATCC 43319 TaxID=1218108 RepID=A0A511NDJ1_9FLAO|nr:hypothetical protein EB1_06740 [Empedobacter brevis NBRC 14943 = ATCC 43319]